MSRRPVVLVVDDREGLLAGAAGTAAMRGLAEVEVRSGPLSEVSDDDLVRVQVLVAVRERSRLDAGALARLPALELLLQTGGHAYHLDEQAASDRGVVVALGRRAVAARAAVPELTFALAVAALRRLPEAQREMADGGWPALTGRTLAGRRLGVLGTGRHGTRVARIARAFDMDVVAWDRPGGSSSTQDGPPRLGLDELLATSDVVSVHLRLSPQSRGLLDAARLAAMRPGSVLVNTARGAVVDEEALVHALRTGPMAAAGLDVFAQEPLPAGHPLRSLPNVVLTPHVGWTVEEVFTEFALIASEQLADYLAGALDPEEVLDPSAVDRRGARLGGVRGVVGPRLGTT